MMLISTFDLLEDLKNSQNRTDGTDMVLYCRDGAAVVHGAMLARVSPRVASLLATRNCRADHAGISLADMDLESVQIIITMLYTGTAKFNNVNCYMGVVNAMKMLGIEIPESSLALKQVDPDRWRRNRIRGDAGEWTHEDNSGAEAGDADMTDGNVSNKPQAEAVSLKRRSRSTTRQTPRKTTRLSSGGRLSSKSRSASRGPDEARKQCSKCGDSFAVLGGWFVKHLAKCGNETNETDDESPPTKKTALHQGYECRFCKKFYDQSHLWHFNHHEPKCPQNPDATTEAAAAGESRLETPDVNAASTPGAKTRASKVFTTESPSSDSGRKATRSSSKAAEPQEAVTNTTGAARKVTRSTAANDTNGASNASADSSVNPSGRSTTPWKKRISTATDEKDHNGSFSALCSVASDEAFLESKLAAFNFEETSARLRAFQLDCFLCGDKLQKAHTLRQHLVAHFKVRLAKLLGLEGSASKPVKEPHACADCGKQLVSRVKLLQHAGAKHRQYMTKLLPDGLADILFELEAMQKEQQLEDDKEKEEQMETENNEKPEEEIENDHKKPKETENDTNKDRPEGEEKEKPEEEKKPEEEEEDGTNKDKPEEEQKDATNKENPEEEEKENATNKEKPEEEKENTTNKEKPEEENAANKEKPEEEQKDATHKKKPKGEEENAANKEKPEEEEKEDATNKKPEEEEKEDATNKKPEEENEEADNLNKEKPEEEKKEDATNKKPEEENEEADNLNKEMSEEENEEADNLNKEMSEEEEKEDATNKKPEEENEEADNLNKEMPEEEEKEDATNKKPEEENEKADNLNKEKPEEEKDDGMRRELTDNESRKGLTRTESSSPSRTPRFLVGVDLAAVRLSSGDSPPDDDGSKEITSSHKRERKKADLEPKEATNAPSVSNPNGFHINSPVPKKPLSSTASTESTTASSRPETGGRSGDLSPSKAFIYACDKCGQAFNAPFLLARHMTDSNCVRPSADSSESPKCVLCQERVLGFAHYRSHLFNKHFEEEVARDLAKELSSRKGRCTRCSSQVAEFALLEHVALAHDELIKHLDTDTKTHLDAIRRNETEAKQNKSAQKKESEISSPGAENIAAVSSSMSVVTALDADGKEEPVTINIERVDDKPADRH